MTDIDLDAIEARAAAATEGPWKYRDILADHAFGDIPALAAEVRRLQHVITDLMAQGQREPDAEFVAHACADVPALVAEVRELEATIARVRVLADRYFNEPDYDTDRGTAGEIRAALDPRVES